MTRRCWTPLGPITAMPSKTKTLVSGRFNAIAVHPTDPNIVFAGSASGGVFKTTDGGVSWTALGNGLPISTFDLDRRVIDRPVSTIALEQTASSLIVAVGTGDHHPFGAVGRGVFVSEDGGATFLRRLVPDPSVDLPGQISTRDLHKARIRAVLPDTGLPIGDGHELVACGEGGIWLGRRRGGLAWDRIRVFIDGLGAPSNGDWTTLAMSAKGLVAASNHVSFSVGKSMDGVYRHEPGNSMVRLHGGLPGRRSFERVVVAAAPSDRQILYAMFGKDDLSEMKLFVSNDSGDSWTERKPPRLFSPRARFGIFLAVHPANPERVYFGDGRSLYHTFDGGRTEAGWGDINEDRVRAIAFGPGPSHAAWIATDDGVWVSPAEGTRTAPIPTPEEIEDEEVPEQLTDWESRSRGLGALRVHSIAVHPTERSIMLGASTEYGALRRRSHPLWSEAHPGEIHQVAIDPNAPMTWYATTTFKIEKDVVGVLQSKDGGTTWKKIPHGLGTSDRTESFRGGTTVMEPCPLVIHPLHKGIVYFGTDMLYRRDDNTTLPEWVPIALVTQSGDPSSAGISAIAVDPTRTDERLYVVDKRGNVFLVDFFSGVPAVQHLADIGTGVSHLEVDPDDPLVLQVALTYPPLAVHDLDSRLAVSSHMAVSHDGGVQWFGSNIQFDAKTRFAWGEDELPTDVRVRRFVRDPTRRALYIATDLGVFVSRPFATGFRDVTGNLPRVPVADIAILPAKPLDGPGSPRRHVLRVATWGRGVWECALPINDTEDDEDLLCDAAGIYLRDDVLDEGEIPVEAREPEEKRVDPLDSKKTLTPEDAIDLKVDRPNKSGAFQKPKSNLEFKRPDDPSAVADFVGFEHLVQNEPQAGKRLHVYLQVHNRGPSAARVRTRVLYAAHSDGHEPLPADVFGFFHPQTGPWFAVGGPQTVAIRPGEPAVVRWTDLELPRDFAPKIRFAAFAAVVAPDDSAPLPLPFLPAENISPNERRMITTVMNVRPAVTQKRGWFEWWMVPAAVGVAVLAAGIVDALDIEGFDTGQI